MTFFVTTAINYVNARPHLGHALEAVQVDTLARNRRHRGEDVRFLTRQRGRPRRTRPGARTGQHCARRRRGRRSRGL